MSEDIRLPKLQQQQDRSAEDDSVPAEAVEGVRLDELEEPLDGDEGGDGRHECAPADQEPIHIGLLIFDGFECF